MIFYTGSCKLDIKECDGELDVDKTYAFQVTIDAGLREEALDALELKYETDWSEPEAKSQCFANEAEEVRL